MLVDRFLREIDRRWEPPAEQRIPLRIIGSTALMLQSDYARGTKDSDIVRTNELNKEIEQRLLAVAGPESAVAQGFRLYIQVVPSGMLFRRQHVEWRALEPINAALRSFSVEVMSVLDVVVTKLKRLNANDLDDIEAMADRELVSHEALVDAFRAAVDFTWDAKADDLPKYRANLHRVERDIFGVSAPTEIELPRWVEDE